MVAALTDPLSIRLMTPQDVPEVYDIEKRAYQFPWSEGIFRECMANGYFCQVVEQEGIIIAYSVLSLVMDEAHLLNIVVDPEFQQRGTGRYLLNQVIELAREQGAATVFLEVRISNTVAYDLYLNEGFVQVGERRGYYKAVNGREDAMVLALPLLDTFPAK